MIQEQWEALERSLKAILSSLTEAETLLRESLMLMQQEEPIRVPDRYQGALQELRNPVYFAGGSHKRDLVISQTGADPRIVKFSVAFIRSAHQLGIPARAHPPYRSNAEQQKLFQEGRSKARPGHSAHNYGKAVDIFHAVKAWDLDDDHWKLFEVIGREVARRQNLKLIWGGEWSPNPAGVGWDPAHWELADWRNE